MPSKYYAVKKGKMQGIFYSWPDCKQMVDGYPNPVYKSFQTVEEADAFIRGIRTEEKTAGAESADSAKKTVTGPTDAAANVYAFVDGSFNSATKVYGYGGFLVHDGKKEVLQGSGCEAEMASMRNVAGEILGAMAAVKRAIELGFLEVTIYYDYMGIEMWATGAWKRNKQGTIAGITESLAAAGISIRALSVADTQEFGILRLIVSDIDKAKTVLSDNNCVVSVTKVIGIEIPDTPGGLSKVLRVIADNGINVEYLYAFITVAGENAYVVLRVEDNENAARIMEENGIKLISQHDVEAL